jgi:hypothetical protein
MKPKPLNPFSVAYLHMKFGQMLSFPSQENEVLFKKKKSVHDDPLSNDNPRTRNCTTPGKFMIHDAHAGNFLMHTYIFVWKP